MQKARGPSHFPHFKLQLQGVLTSVQSVTSFATFGDPLTPYSLLCRRLPRHRHWRALHRFALWLANINRHLFHHRFSPVRFYVAPS